MNSKAVEEALEEEERVKGLSLLVLVYSHLTGARSAAAEAATAPEL